MSFQAYLDAVKAKTGKTSDEFRALAAEKGLVKSGEIVAWLKSDYELGHGHASAIASMIVHADKRNASPEDLVAELFSGKKATWRPAYDALATEIAKFGTDVEMAPNLTYVNVRRGARKFAIVQLSSAARLDIGVKLRDVASSGRLEAAGSWNSMMSHRVRIDDPAQIDGEVLAWLRQAYDAA
jgi:hypothetical protein